MRIYELGEDIWEGQFEKDQLHGFGRHIEIQPYGRLEIQVGYWNNGQRHGFNRTINEKGEVFDGPDSLLTLTIPVASTHCLMKRFRLLLRLPQP